MRMQLQELLTKLYVFRSIDPYDTEQWSTFNEDVNVTCSAEVRADGYDHEVEAIEAQIIISKQATANEPAITQICYIKAERQKKGDFRVMNAIIRGKEKADSSIYNWAEKSCKFFMLTAQELEKGNLPDFDEIEKQAFEERGRFGDKWGDGDSRTPSINTDQLMKVGRGF